MRRPWAVLLGSLLALFLSASGCASDGQEGVPVDEVVDIREPAWSPDGRSIAFAGATGEERLAIYLVRPDGRDLVRLTPRSLEAAGPVWSPDGKRIAFLSSGALGTADRRELYVVGRDGTGIRRLTSNGVDDTHPSWSPDGQRIAFERRGDIYTMSPRGTALRQLTRSGYNRFASWSPDGRRIAYAHFGGGFGLSHVYIVPDAGGRSKRLTSPRETAAREAVAWSPRGDLVAFWEDGSLAVVDVAHGSIRRLRKGLPGSLHSVVSWSPDGRRIAFNRSEGDFYGPYTTDLIDVRSGRSTPLHEFLGNELSWSPDSRWIAFVNGSINRQLDVIRSNGGEDPRTIVDNIGEAREASSESSG